jgi:hypothetical protein
MHQKIKAAEAPGLIYLLLDPSHGQSFIEAIGFGREGLPLVCC